MRSIAFLLLLAGCAAPVVHEVEQVEEESPAGIPSTPYISGRTCGNAFERIELGNRVYMVALPCEMGYVDMGDPPPRYGVQKDLIDLPRPSVESR